VSRLAAAATVARAEIRLLVRAVSCFPPAAKSLKTSPAKICVFIGRGGEPSISLLGYTGPIVLVGPIPCSSASAPMGVAISAVDPQLGAG